MVDDPPKIDRRQTKNVHYEHVEILADMVRLSGGFDEEITFENVGEIWKKNISPKIEN